MRLESYSDFVRILLNAGFSFSGGNADGIYAAVPFDWRSEPSGSKIIWHTGDPETDPWEWRIRVLQERNDVAYGKMFFRKGGFITRKWYPYFLAVRRKGMDFDTEYESGAVSYFAKRIYEAVREYGHTPYHEIKRLGRFSREDNSRFERALVELQMKLYLTISGEQPKTSANGVEYGWPSTVFCTTEMFWGGEVFAEADEMISHEAEEAVIERILELNPAADERKMLKFIRG